MGFHPKIMNFQTFGKNSIGFGTPYSTYYTRARPKCQIILGGFPFELNLGKPKTAHFLARYNPLGDYIKSLNHKIQL